MACASLSITSSSPGNNSTADQQQQRSLCRSYSYSYSHKDFKCHGRIKRSYSDNHLCYSINSNRAEAKLKSSHSTSMFSFQMIPNTFGSILSDPEASQGMTEEEDEEVIETKRANWIERLMEIRSQWIERKENEKGDEDEDGELEKTCEVDYGDELVEEDGKMVMIDSDSFTKLLSTVSWSDARFLSRLAFLSNSAYVIHDLKATDLKRKYGLRLVTSSLEKKAAAEAAAAGGVESKSELNGDSSDSIKLDGKKVVKLEQKRLGRPALAYENIAASAASYVQCQTNQTEEVEPRVHKSEVAAFAAASTMTVVVAAGEKEKQEAAKDLRSLHSSPCEWFVCDDPNTYTRCFIIQGSDSLASWQANLFFEPTQFEGRDVLVHRGIYEAAKGIYEQFMDDIMDHLNRYGERAKLQFTGHSLGGSLSLLVHLMLLTRGVVKPNVLRPVVTFGSPFVFCGGQRILKELGLNEDCVHCVIMHRDIVPRAFTCNYPPYVAHILKRLNSNFRSHPCLNKNKLLYTPLGKIFILQPEDESSPRHPLLPPESGLYALEHTQWCNLAEKALRDFLNFPHPLETLSDPTAYGTDGTILRDHHSGNYLKAINGFLNKQTGKAYEKVRKHRSTLRPIITSQSPQIWIHKHKRLVLPEVMSTS
ncbi:phospholipase A1 PLIP1, chloroplastic [Impatiens glandulifera]|uniref:phospholipase A1 PLIP1, chloroplastic n=1 Tax=Impatiens glandulifera TaxID=253017 RepID=UPI001FB0BE60|nr:phospholipase A1 PLIP1, chloroplastic [Impatiens glandulifera]